MAIEKDLTTVIGVTFFDHGETPGLGGECAAPWFQEQFSGKKVRREPFQVVKGGAPPDCDHCVDGIAAATITGNGIQAFINKDLGRYEPYFKSIRGT
jgi:Na+-transporting NADH:ubiquinone oxidoreductase subunit C